MRGWKPLRRRNASSGPIRSFLRTSDGHEIVLVLDLPGTRWAIEFKLTSNPSPQDLRKFEKHADWIDADKRVLVSRTNEVIESRSAVSCGLAQVIERIG